MALGEVVLRVHKKQINHKSIVLDVEYTMLDKDKVLNITGGGVEAS